MLAETLDENEVGFVVFYVMRMMFHGVIYILDEM